MDILAITDKDRELFAACFDTNLIVELSLTKDLEEASIGTTGTPDFSKLKYRHSRARATHAAAWLCHRDGLRTFSIHSEVASLLDRLAPQGSTQATWAWFYMEFLKPQILPNWGDGMAPSPEEIPSGDGRDRYLVDVARAQGCPVVTHEVAPDGAIARAAASHGVRVFESAAWIESRGESIAGLAEEMAQAVERSFPAFASSIVHLPISQNCTEYYHHLRWVLADVDFEDSV